MIREIVRIVAPIRRRVLLMIGRAVVTLVDDEGGRQAVQLAALAGEVLDNIERFQEYGFSSVPLPGAEGVLLAMAGMRQHSVAVAVEDRRYRPTGLSPGEVCLYTAEDTDAEPHRVVLQNGRIVRFECASTRAVFGPDSITLVAGGSTFTLTDQGVRQTAANGAALVLDDEADFNVNLGVDGDINPTGNVDGIKVSKHDHDPGELRDAENRPLTGDTAGPNAP